MPWKRSVIMDEKMKFIGRLLEGEKMTKVCRDFGISRKTGYKFWNRYLKVGLHGLKDRSRKPYRYANQLPMQIEKAVLGIKKKKPTWGAPKIREIIKQKFPEVNTPAKSTMHCILDRHGLVKRKKKRYKARGTTLIDHNHPNDLWCADYKGEFMMGNKKYCYPLTISDYSSRYLLCCEALEATKREFTFDAFKRTFEKFGLPKTIRTDNGVPFASSTSLFGLSRLSVWWLRLGICVERTRPGNPQENGRHERMHLTLKQEATKPAGENILQQQEKFDSFIEEFNNYRPHQALDMKTPSQIYKNSLRNYKKLEPLAYPFHDKTIKVTQCGRICYKDFKVSLSRAFAGENVGIKETEDGIWLVSFMEYDLGYFDEKNNRLEPLEYPFAPTIV